MTTQTTQNATNTRANAGADMRDQRDPLEEPYGILVAALAFNAGKANEEPRKGFESQYFSFVEGWPRVTGLKKTDPRRAISTAWGIANSCVLCDPMVMAFFIRGAYQEYTRLMTRATETEEATEEWGQLQDRVARLESNLMNLLNWPEAATRAEVAQWVASEQLEHELKAAFDKQNKAEDQYDRRGNANLRKWVFQDAKSVFGKARQILFGMPEPVQKTAPMKTDEERAAERAERDRKREARRQQDIAYRLAQRGANGGGGSNKGKGKGK